MGTFVFTVFLFTQNEPLSIIQNYAMGGIVVSIVLLILEKYFGKQL